jgi:hypothetical protein
LRELQKDEDFYGLLLPRPPAVANIKSIGREMAGLLRSLATPSRLTVQSVNDDELIDLVLDGVLEVENDGQFVSGAAALPLFCEVCSDREEDDLSTRALRHAADLESSDPRFLTNALYLFNRIPLTRFWKTRFPDREGVLRWLGADGGHASFAPATEWSLMPEAQSNGWIVWHSRRATHRRNPDQPTYKLYVSPRPEHLREVVETVARTLAERGGSDFKIGRDAAGLLRPDKLVAYFPSWEELVAVSDRLQARLNGCPAHGVPFTGAIDDAGLFSWGLDPPDTARALSWLGRESWRLWLATQLAAAMAFARSSALGSDPNIEPWRFARERVRRLGVDVDSWTPGPELWRQS